MPDSRMVHGTDGQRPVFEEEPEQRLSLVRVFMALLLVAGVAYGAFEGVRSKLAPIAASTSVSWFAPYVDVTLTPTYSFQSPGSNPAAQTVLGFVVATPGSPCTPSWGAVDSLPQADQSIALSARVAELEQQGARAIVSFGGRSNTDLAVGCKDSSSLVQAYQSVIDRYHLHTIDLDVEGTALDDLSATRRRAAAIRQLQMDAQRHHTSLGVWLTLPVEPTGLQDNALSVLDSMLSARVDLAGVNILAMDFGHAPSGGSMIDPVERAATAAQGQLADQFRSYGVVETSRQVWQRIGITVMIGQNDVAGERFTTADARSLLAFVNQRNVGRVSMWSLNRDVQCGSTFAQVGLNSNTCSGTPQAALEFSRTFSALGGKSSGTSVAPALPPQPDTDPAAAPFPLWAPDSSYQSGYKVVRDGYIYQAKWYNTGQDPGQQVQYSWQSPWELLGPVLPGDHAPTLPTLPAGTYPSWSTSADYHAGDRVLYNGLGYAAKWANQGASPQEAVLDPAGSPWRALYTIPGEPTGGG